MSVFHIPRDTAVGLTKQRVMERAESAGFMQKIMINVAISTGKIEQIVDEVYALGLCVAGRSQQTNQQRLYAITLPSAINIARWRVTEKLKTSGAADRVALQAALDNGKIDEIFTELYQLGYCIAAHEDNTAHKAWLASGSMARE